MTTKINPLRNVKALAAGGHHAEAFSALCTLALPEADFIIQHRWAMALEAIDLSRLELKPVRVALVASSVIDYLAPLLRLRLAIDGFAADIFLADYDTVDQTVLDPKSALYTFRPDIIWLFTNHRDVRAEIRAGASVDEIENALASDIARFQGLWEAVARNCSAFVLQNNADLPLTRVFGNLEGGVPWGRGNVLRRFNLSLVETARSGVAIFDLDHVAAEFGKAMWQDERYWFHGKTPFALDALGLVAFQGARLIAAIKGRTRKCLVLDLDNTLWGGVIGDDGLDGIKLGNNAIGEAFLAFQDYVLGLKSRGVILAVCSKNNDEIARLPFDSHPDMRLRLEDIAMFVANWDNKADNIRGIAETLGIGLDSLVFIDDTPAERELVRRLLPMVTVPELPDDPALFVRTLDAARLFETVAFSEEDRSRSEMYRGNAQRKILMRSHTDISEYLRDLDMRAEVGLFDAMTIPRVAQLVNKSNQFHLTTTRYTEAEIRAFADSPRHICRWFKLKDRLGDNGLIALVIMGRRGDGLAIDTLVMSCRVLSRTMEEFIINEIIELAKSGGATRLFGRYIPTRKNKLVEGLYSRMRFAMIAEADGTTDWELEITPKTEPRRCFIARAAHFPKEEVLPP